MEKSLQLTELEARKYNELEKNHGNGNVSFSSLRMETSLVNAQSRYPFNVLKQGNELATEIKLDKNDTFVATRIAMFVYERDSVLKDEGRKILQTYVNPAAFTADGVNFLPADINTIYGGFLQFKKGTKVIIESLDTDNFLEVPETQKSGVSNESSKYRDSAYMELIPQIAITGKEAFAIDANFPTFNAIKWQSTVAGKTIQVVLKVRGFLVKGASL